MGEIQDTVDLIINEAIERAQDQADTAQTKVDEAIQAASQLIIPATPQTYREYEELPTGIVPPSLPAQDYLTIFQDAQNLLKDEILSESSSEYNAFVNKYFPLTLNAVQVAWLEDKILNGDTGLPQHIEDAIHNRGVDRINREMARGEEDVIERFAALGWADPPGALAFRLRRIREDARMKVCEFSRDVAINQAERAQQNVQFAVAEATKLQQIIWNAADSFSNSITRAIGPAVQSGAGQADAAARFYDQTLQYYRTFFFAEEMGQVAHDKNIERTFRMNEQAIKVLSDKAARMTEAALGAARVFGDMSSASLSGQNTMASAVVRELA